MRLVRNVAIVLASSSWFNVVPLNKVKCCKKGGKLTVEFCGLKLENAVKSCTLFLKLSGIFEAVVSALGGDSAIICVREVYICIYICKKKERKSLKVVVIAKCNIKGPPK